VATPDDEQDDPVRGAQINVQGSSAADQRMNVWVELCADVTALAQRWALYKQLFGNTAHIELMREVAAFSFGLYQGLLRESILLGIQRLLDRHTVSGNVTLSIATLLTMKVGGAPATDREVRSRLAGDLKQLQTDCEVIKQWRDQRLAHRDLVMLTSEVPEIVTPTVLEAIEGLAILLDAFGRHFYGLSYALDEADTPDGDRLMVRLAPPASNSSKSSRGASRLPADRRRWLRVFK
jgi:hypothetical protein